MKPIYYIWILIASVLVVYGSSLDYGFVLDDETVITNNTTVNSGLDATTIDKAFSENILSDTKYGDVNSYRPLLVLSLAADVTMNGGIDSPLYFHLINILITIILALLLYRVLTFHNEWFSPFLAFVVTGLFVLHPMKVESIVNIKGRDDILSFVGILLVVFAIQSKPNSIRWLLSILGAFIALFSKETALVVLPLILLYNLYMTGFKFKKNLNLYLPSIVFIVMSSVFFILRTNALEGIESNAVGDFFNPYAQLDGFEYFAMCGYSLFKGIATFLLPNNLLHLYLVGDLTVNSTSMIIGSAVILLACALLIYNFYKKNKEASIYLFCLYVLIAFQFGFIFKLPYAYADRSMFILSLALIVPIIRYLGKKNKAVLMAPLLIYPIITISYSRNWSSNDELLAYYDSNSDSFLSEYRQGMLLLSKNNCSDAIPHLDKAYDLNSKTYLTTEAKAVGLFNCKDKQLAKPYYKTAYSQSIQESAPLKQESSYHYLADYHFQDNKMDSVAIVLNHGLKHYPTSYELNVFIGDYYLLKKEIFDSAVIYYNTAVTNHPQKDNKGIIQKINHANAQLKNQ